MKLKLNQLKSVVKETIVERKHVDALRNEARRVLGPIMNTNLGIVELAEAINDRLDIIRLTGRSVERFKTSVVARFAGHAQPEVRAMAARLLPESMIVSLGFDPSAKVRSVVARRASSKVLNEMVRRFPRDEQLTLIKEEREEEFDMNGEKPLGDASKTYDADGDELSDVWYENKARELYADYSQHDRIDVSWGRIVNGFVDSTRATSLVEIDKKKLMDAIKKVEDERVESLLGEGSVRRNRRQHDVFDFDVLKEHADVAVFPVIEETIDPVKDAVSEGSISRIKELFKITESRPSRTVSSFLMTEGVNLRSVPFVGTLPHRGELRRIDEQALDMFVNAWNSKQSAMNHPLEINWSQDHSNPRRIHFIVSVK